MESLSQYSFSMGLTRKSLFRSQPPQPIPRRRPQLRRLVACQLSLTRKYEPNWPDWMQNLPPESLTRRYRTTKAADGTDFAEPNLRSNA